MWEKDDRFKDAYEYKGKARITRSVFNTDDNKYQVYQSRPTFEKGKKEAYLTFEGIETKKSKKFKTKKSAEKYLKETSISKFAR